METPSRHQVWNANRQWRKHLEAERKELAARRAAENIKADFRHFRDQAEPQRVASGVALNFLLKQFNTNLEMVDFVDVKLSESELKSIRLQTTEGITAAQLNWSFDPSGRIQWPEEMELDELVEQRTAVEEAVKKLCQIEGEGLTAKTQIKRVQQKITELRSLAGTVLRDQKHDPIGADACRTFLRQLDGQLVKVRSISQQNQLQIALRPEVRTADELMRHVARNNLRFAPCEDPTAAAYHALHGKLAEAHRDLHRPYTSLHASK